MGENKTLLDQHSIALWVSYFFPQKPDATIETVKKATVDKYLGGRANFFNHTKKTGMPEYPAPYMAVVDIKTMKIVAMSTAKPLRLLKTKKAIETCASLK